MASAAAGYCQCLLRLLLLLLLLLWAQLPTSSRGALRFLRLRGRVSVNAGRMIEGATTMGKRVSIASHDKEKKTEMSEVYIELVDLLARVDVDCLATPSWLVTGV